MARAWRIRYAGAKYHITVRGNARQEVFHNDEYCIRFVEQLADALEKDQVVLYAFVLMPNHYHLFVETPLGNIQRFMQRLNTSYSMYHRYKENKGVYGDIRWPEGRKLKLEEIAAKVAGSFKIAAADLLTRKVEVGVARKLALELSCRYSGQSQRKVGEYYGYKGNGSVLKQRQRLGVLMSADEKLRKRLVQLEKDLAKR